jgi:hypothetical protein
MVKDSACLGRAIIVLSAAAAFLGDGFIGIIFLVAELHCLSSGVFVWGTVSSFWTVGQHLFGHHCFFGERVRWLRCVLVWVEPSLFWLWQQDFWVDGFIGGICLAAALCHLSSGVVVWGMASSFWGDVLFFWWRQCHLLGSGSIMERT